MTSPPGPWLGSSSRIGFDGRRLAVRPLRGAGEAVQLESTATPERSDQLERAEAHHPHVLEGFNAPATAEAIAHAEMAIGQPPPDDSNAFLAIHDGQDEFAAFVGLGALLPVAKVAATKLDGWHDSDAPAPDPGEVGVGIRVVCSPGWIPISRSHRGRDFLCLDLDPGPNGRRGQVLEYAVDATARPLVAPSFADLLSLYLEGIQAGEIDLEDPEN